jgi:predicted metal-dependent TIM-barrel fold hydrolase
MIALQEAVKLGGADADQIVANAYRFETFLMGSDAGTQKADKPAKAPKADKPAKTETPVEAKVETPKVIETPKRDLTAEVKGVIKALLEAGLRDETGELLKGHGAASATSLSEKGAAAVDAFKAAANDLLLAA